MDHNRHAGHVALVTGAASGIGRATAIRVAGEGATVVATDVDAAGLDELAATIDGVTTVVGDLTTPGFIDSLVDAAEAVGPVDILANVAGIMDHFVPAGDVDDELWASVLAVNLTAPMQLCRRLIPLMSARGGGSIVNVSSAAGIGGSGAGAAYHASKHGLIGLTRHIAYVYRPQAIRCNAVCPGGVNTGIGETSTPTVPWAFERQLMAITLNERMAEPTEIATVISWLSSDEAGNVNGVVLSADGGWKAA